MLKTSWWIFFGGILFCLLGRKKAVILLWKGRKLFRNIKKKTKKYEQISCKNLLQNKDCAKEAANVADSKLRPTKGGLCQGKHQSAEKGCTLLYTPLPPANLNLPTTLWSLTQSAERGSTYSPLPNYPLQIVNLNIPTIFWSLTQSPEKGCTPHLPNNPLQIYSIYYLKIPTLWSLNQN